MGDARVVMPPLRAIFFLEDALKMYMGLPPHNVPENYYWGCPHFADEIEAKYDETIGDLVARVGLEWPKEQK